LRGVLVIEVTRAGTAALALCIGVGAALRWVNLEQKPYWFNEAFTALRVSGYDEHDEVIPALYTGRPVRADDILEFQRPNADRGTWHTVRGLARKEPHQPPLYFVMARAAAAAGGETVRPTRALSAVWGVAALAACYWLCRELFASPSVAAIATALMALSPFFVRYSQEARPYSLWTAAMLFSSACLLRAVRTGRRRSWVAYSLLLMVGLYAHLLTALVLAVHGIYVLVVARRQPRPTFRPFVTAAGAAVLAFAPWLAVLGLHWSTAIAVSGYLGEPQPAAHVLDSLATDLTHLFSASPPIPAALVPWFAVALTALLGYAAYTLVRRASVEASVFIFLLMLVPVAAMALPDLLFGGQRILRARYLTPACFAMIAAVAFLLAEGISTIGGRSRVAWCASAAALCALAGVSSVAGVRAPSWWGLSMVDVDLAALLNRSPAATIITDVPFGVIAPLAALVREDVRFVMTRRPELLRVPPTAGPLYLYQPSDDLRRLATDRTGLPPRVVYQRAREDRTVYTLYRIDQAP
jgi:uncharacterized membrane protein